MVVTNMANWQYHLGHYDKLLRKEDVFLNVTGQR
jgi:hypothetical protein